jgi:hypothetical protein
MPTYIPLVLNNRELALPKAVVSPKLGARTVLTNEPWDFVDLALARQKKTDARFYWQQAREFFDVTAGLSLHSAPLLLYYAFMNAAKALLASKGGTFSPRHGVKEWSPDSTSTLDDLTVGIRIKQSGILPALAAYYNETEQSVTHTISDIFYNLPFIHRTYCLTNDPLQEMFIPVVNPQLVVEDGTKSVFLMAQLTANFPNPRYCPQLPPSLVPLPAPQQGHVLSATSVTISSTVAPSAADIQAMCGLINALREDVFYINGVDTLWYVKAVPPQLSRLRRQTTTLTLAAMHRLSEESRYHPKRLAKCLEGENNWLVSEFIKMSGVQFIDEIASEITGMQFLKPNVRPAK